MKRAVLAVPVLFFLLSLDRLAPDPPPAVVEGLPGRNEGRLGRPGDPLGFTFAGSARTVRAALSGAGWSEIPTSVRGALAAGSLPMNDYRLAGRRQDMNWVIQVRPLQERHHFRLWDTGRRDAKGRELWWGSGNYDLRIRWRDLSHTPDPDADRERDFLTGTLRGSPLVESVSLEALPQIPLSGANDKGYPFRTDGRAAVVVLRP